MESAPKFIKEFSKKESKDERDSLAHEIKSARRADFESKEQKEVAELHRLRDEILNTSDTLPKKIAEYIRYMSIRFNLLRKGAVTSPEPNAPTLSYSMEEAKLKIDAFYKKQREKWSHTPYNKEDIKNHFSPEHLSSLPLEEYILLLKRFPGQMVTHVTRQGVRDHLGAVDHQGGADNFSDGFKKILQAGELKSALGIFTTESAKDDFMSDYLQLENQSKEEALKVVAHFAGEDTQHYHGSLADRQSIHFATEEVADAHYGAETENEIFFAFPSALIASQYIFSGQLTEAGGDYHNNQWVFTEEDNEVPIEAGLIFIPKNSQVDRTTGSKYDLDNELRPIVNEDLINTIREIVSKPDFREFAAEYGAVLGGTPMDTETLLSEVQHNSQSEISYKVAEALQALSSKFGVSDKSTQRILLNYSFLSSVCNSEPGNAVITTTITDRLRQVGLAFTLADDTVSSEEYWSEYIEKNSAYEQLKVVYYEEKDPTLALRNWKSHNGLYKKGHDSNLGFSENTVSLSKPDDVNDKLPSIGRFRALAEDIIERFYD